MEECTKCKRLVHYRRSIRPKSSPLFNNHYWNKPVPLFGDPGAWLLIVGLAPGAHGVINRTGKPFQGDKAGDLLYAALHETGFCNLPAYQDGGRQIVLNGALIDNAVRCVPPENRPTGAEFRACRPHLEETIQITTITDILCIGRDAYIQMRKVLKQTWPDFKHGISCGNGRLNVHCCYHTSGYNQATGRIKKDDVVAVLNKIKQGRETLICTTRL